MKSPTIIPTQIVVQCITGAPKSDDSGVLEVGEAQGTGAAGDNADDNNDKISDNNDGGKLGYDEENGDGDVIMIGGENGSDEGGNGDED